MNFERQIVFRNIEGPMNHARMTAAIVAGFVLFVIVEVYRAALENIDLLPERMLYHLVLVACR